MSQQFLFYELVMISMVPGVAPVLILIIIHCIGYIKLHLVQKSMENHEAVVNIHRIEHKNNIETILHKNTEENIQSMHNILLEKKHKEIFLL